MQKTGKSDCLWREELSDRGTGMEQKPFNFLKRGWRHYERSKICFYTLGPYEFDLFLPMPLTSISCKLAFVGHIQLKELIYLSDSREIYLINIQCLLLWMLGFRGWKKKKMNQTLVIKMIELNINLLMLCF